MNLPNQTIFKLKATNYRVALALKSPKLFDLEELVYPKNSIIHYCTFNQASFGPTLNEPFFSRIGRKLPIAYIKSYETPIGTMMYYTNKFANLANIHRRENKIFKFAEEDTVKPLDPMSPLIVNYDLVGHLYKYKDRYDVGYNIWYNTEKTLWANVLKYLRLYPESNNFVTIDLDNEMPTLSNIRVSSKLTGRAMLKFLKNREDFLSKEIFIYFIKQRAIKEGKKTSDLRPTFFDDYTEEDFKRLNIVIVKNGKYGVYPVNDLIDKLHKKAEASKYMPYEFIRIITLKFFQLSEASKILDVVNANTTDSDISNQEPITKPDSAIDTLPKDNTSTKKDESEDIFNLELEDDFEGIDFDIPLDETDDLAELSNNVLIDDEVDDLAGTVSSDIKEEATSKPLTSEELNKTISIDNFIEPENPTNYLTETVNKLVLNENVSEKDAKSLLKEIEQSKQIISPITGNLLSKDAQVTIDDVMIKPSSTDINIDAKVTDDTMLHSTLLDFDKNYIKNVLHKDMSSVILNVQKSGMIIKDFNIKPTVNAATKTVEYSFKVKPIDGNESTLKYTLPIINNDGSYLIGGVNYKLRKQRRDLPIRKTKHNEVALTTHYGKLFVNRSSQKRFDISYWLYNKIISMYQDPNSGVTGIVPTPAFHNYDKTPLIYSFLNRYFKELTINNNVFYLTYSDRKTIVGDRYDVDKLESKGTYVLCGISKEGNPILIDHNNLFVTYEENTYKPLGTIYDLLNIAEPKFKEFVDIKILGVRVPVVYVLSFLVGLKPLLKYTGVNYKLYPSKEKVDDTNNIVVKFLNYKLVINNPTKEQELLFGGFAFIKDELEKYNLEAFDDRSVYLGLLESKDVKARNLKELVLLDQMFIDPMSKQVLEIMKEPTTFKGLLFRSIELLLTDWYPDSQDTEYQAITGYERINGILYKHLVDTIRGYKLKNLYNKTKLDLNPLAVSMELSKDQILISTINPIDDLKQQEDVTYTGFGGRTKQSLNKKSRAFHKNDIGIMSEATKESGDVGINAYLSTNPSITNLRGMVKPLSDKELNPSSFYSVAGMLAPGSIYDAAVRVNFVSVQQAHTISTVGYHQPYIRTGYEYVVAKRTTEQFAYAAEDDGVVDTVNENFIVVKYKDGTKKGVKLGNTIGHSEGQYYVHPIVTKLKEGMTFKKGKIIAYNSFFFEQDMLYPDEVILKMYKLVKTAIVENADVFEDSSSVRDTVGESFNSEVLEQRKFTIEVNQEVVLNVKKGSKVKANDVLLYMLDKYESLPNEVDNDTLEALKRFSNIAPKANLEGSIMNIECYYNAELEDMSPSLLKIAKESNKQLAEKTKHDSLPIINGKVDSSYRVDGNQLTPGKAVIIIYLKHTDGLGVGDKLVFANQMKTVIGGVIDYPIVTTDGEQVDAFFGFRSILARVVNSPVIIGTTNVLLSKFTKKFIEEYKK